MLKKYVEDTFRFNNVVIPFSKVYLCKINIYCPVEIFPLIIRWGGYFVTT